MLEEVYICVSLGCKGVAATNLIDHVQCATGTLKRLRQTTSRRHLYVLQRRWFAKNVVLSICHYLLYVQLMTNNVLEAAS